MENQEQNSWVKTSITLKLLIVGVLVLLFLIPSLMIRSLISERESTSMNVVNEISSKWGNSQTITGPMVSIPYKIHVKDSNYRTTMISYINVLPEDLNINGNLTPEIRYRSMYNVIVYKAELKIDGEFKKPNLDEFKINPDDILWNDAFITVGIPDMRGINKQIAIQWNNRNLEVSPGTITKDMIASGVTAKIGKWQDTAYRFTLNLDINGSETLFFAPLGKETKVDLVSTWETPKFDGAFLPDTKTIDKSGFKAHWEVLHLNRNYPQQWIGANYEFNSSSFGVKLLMGVDQYQKVMRAAKYAIMFIALTFLVFLFTEILNKYRIHPVQYLLVGLGLSIFYTLLLSFSEHIGFNASYLISSVAIIGLISLYANSIFKNIRLTMLMTAILLVLYAFLFTILQLEDYSLLFGSIGLFIVLAVIMYLSRKVDWYSEGKKTHFLEEDNTTE